MPLHFAFSTSYITQTPFSKMSAINLDHINFYNPVPCVSSLKRPSPQFHTVARMDVPNNRDIEVSETQPFPLDNEVKGPILVAEVPIQSSEARNSDIVAKGKLDALVSAGTGLTETEKWPSTTDSLFGDDSEDEELPSMEQLLSQAPAKANPCLDFGRSRLAANMCNEGEIGDSQVPNPHFPLVGQSQGTVARFLLSLVSSKSV